MKPISVRFQCFGPYMAEQFIDFTRLEAGGLFLICGETGAGKTTILDAICYALYGKSSGNLRGDFSVMRCKLAEKEETFTEFIFESCGKQYKFTRSLKMGRKNLNDSHNCLQWEDGAWVPIFENPKATAVNKKAEELIGLTYEQFRQVIILPQGQFEKLLVSNSEEKEKILVSLFHADRWQRIAEEIYRRVARQDEQLKEEKKQITYKLKEYHLDSPAQLEEVGLIRREELAQMQLQAEQSRQAIAAGKQVYEQALLQNQEFEALEKLETERDALLGREGYFAREAEILSRADSAEQIHRPYVRQQEAAQRCRRARELAENRKAARERAEAELQKKQTRYEAHEQENPQQEQRLKRLTLLENAREIYRVLAQKQRLAQASAQTLKTAEAEEQKAEAVLKQAETNLQQALSHQENAYLSYTEANRAYLQGIGGVLAQRLTQGEPCPVCGSREHPAPAARAEHSVTEQELDKLTQAMNEANQGANTSREKRTKAEQSYRKARETCQQARQEAAVAQSGYENALTQTVPGIDSSEKLEAAILNLQSGIDAFRKQEKLLTEALQTAKANLTAAEAAETAAAEEAAAGDVQWAAARAAWQEAMAQAGFETEKEFLACDLDPADRQRRREALVEYRAQRNRNRELLEEKKQQLAGQSKPDMMALRIAQVEKERQLQMHMNRLALAENSLSKLEEDTRLLKKLSERYEIARVKTDCDLDFANRLRGRNGVSLQRYVLGVMLTAITTQANRLLEGVYGGRYRLYRTDEVAGSARKSGLELEVLDNHMGARRSVTTLSGGEKFLVALSLAIGLSAVVQAQGSGIRLEAMFIDEGFGSLDRDAVHDALDVLQGIGGKAGLVGIISHVEALAETIPAKIEIQKGKNGSNCVIRA